MFLSLQLLHIVLTNPVAVESRSKRAHALVLSVAFFLDLSAKQIKVAADVLAICGYKVNATRFDDFSSVPEFCLRFICHCSNLITDVRYEKRKKVSEKLRERIIHQNLLKENWNCDSLRMLQI